MKINRGFKVVKQEQERKEEEAKNRQGKLWRVFFGKNSDEDTEIPIHFLTDEPICFYEHTKQVGGKFNNYPCEGNDCPHCEDGDKPRFVGAFLVIDHTEYSYDERDDKGNKTGKTLTGKDNIKLLVRGQNDLSTLDRLNSKYGLLDREWTIFKTGTGTGTKWSFDRGELEELDEDYIQSVMPEKYQGVDLYEILEAQITGEDLDEPEEAPKAKRSTKDAGSKVKRGVQTLDEDDEDEDDYERPSRKASPKASPKPSASKKLKRR